MGFMNFLHRRSIDDSNRSFSLQNGRPVLTASATSFRSASLASVSAPTSPLFPVSQTTRGHIDLLDAHGGIRPYDFRSRVQASGVRDYGEDVAERNMGENGVDVQSPASRDFYGRQDRRLTQTASISNYGLEMDQSTSEGSNTNKGSELSDLSSIDRLMAKRASSRNSSEPGRERTGMFERPPVATKTNNTSKIPGHRNSLQQAVASDNCQITTSNLAPRGRQPTKRHSVPTEQLKYKTDWTNWRHSSLHSPSSTSQDRSMSPPSVPRYRPDRHGSLAAKCQEAGSSHHSSRQREDNRSPRPMSALTTTTTGDASSISAREDLQNPSLERLCLSDNEAEPESSGVLPAVAVRAAKPRLVAVAPSAQEQAQWQAAVRCAVEQALAQLPFSVDLKALVGESQNGGAGLDEDRTRKLLARQSRHRSLNCSSPTTDYSDCASINTGRSLSRHTATASIDSSVRADTPLKSWTIILDGKSSAGDDYQSSPTVVVDEDTDLEAARLRKDITTYKSNAKGEIEDFEFHGSDSSDVDSFTHSRKRMLKNEDQEGTLFQNNGFGDLSTNLPGLATPEPTNNCTLCNILANLHGRTVPSGPCDHNGPLNQKQRLRALGYDYDSDESDLVPAKTPAAKKSRTKKLTSGSGGGLRRLKLVDDRIDEASEEERTGNVGSMPRLGIRRKSKLGNLSLAPLPTIAIPIHTNSNTTDKE